MKKQWKSLYITEILQIVIACQVFRKNYAGCAAQKIAENHEKPIATFGELVYNTCISPVNVRIIADKAGAIFF